VRKKPVDRPPHGAVETVKDAPDVARRQARGNPLAAGAVALAAGWLVGSLLPASSKERELATTVKEQAQPLVDEATSVAKETAANLKEPAQQAVDSVKETAREGAQHVRDDGSSAVQDVKEAAGNVTGDAKLKSEGRADQVAGKVQNAVGGVKDAIRDATMPHRLASIIRDATILAAAKKGASWAREISWTSRRGVLPVSASRFVRPADSPPGSRAEIKRL